MESLARGHPNLFRKSPSVLVPLSSRIEFRPTSRRRVWSTFVWNLDPVRSLLNSCWLIEVFRDRFSTSFRAFRFILLGPDWALSDNVGRKFSVDLKLSLQNGTTWKKDRCTLCSCHEGQVECQETRCERRKCPAGQKEVTPPNECCPKCIEVRILDSRSRLI